MGMHKLRAWLWNVWVSINTAPCKSVCMDTGGAQVSQGWLLNHERGFIDLNICKSWISTKSSQPSSSSYFAHPVNLTSHSLLSVPLPRTRPRIHWIRSNFVSHLLAFSTCLPASRVNFQPRDCDYVMLSMKCLQIPRIIWIMACWWQVVLI